MITTAECMHPRTVRAPREQPRRASDVDPKGNEQEAAELSHASVRECHCNDAEEGSAREENARGETRDAGLRLEIDIREVSTQDPFSNI